MQQLTFNALALTLFILLTISVYLMIIIVFLYARNKYVGGVIERVINMIISTIGFFLVADIALFLIQIYGFQLGFSIHVFFKILAMTSLAIGGLRFVIR